MPGFQVEAGRTVCPAERTICFSGKERLAEAVRFDGIGAHAHSIGRAADDDRIPFVVRLPAKLMIPPHFSLLHLRDRKPRILAVDDYARNLRVVKETLTARDFEVFTATSGAEALKEVHEHLPDIILLDLMMPVMDGLEVCRRLKAHTGTQDIPIIFLTAADEKKLVTKALDLGAVDYVVKPFNPAELMARVRTHLELKDTRDELRRIIAQKNDLMSVVAHDLKNPLGTIRMSASLLKEQKGADATRTELVDSIISACDDSLAFINARLERNARELGLARLSVEEFQLADVLVPVLQQNAQAATAKNIQLEVVGDAGVGIKVSADYLAMVQVIDNLVSNAVKFTPRGGSVWIDVARQGEMASIEIRDQGPGLTAEDQAHLFEPYRRLSAQPTGGESSTGLGLSIARQLMEAMGGKIGCRSAPGEGACFWVSLPSVG